MQYRKPEKSKVHVSIILEKFIQQYSLLLYRCKIIYRVSWCKM